MSGFIPQGLPVGEKGAIAAIFRAQAHFDVLEGGAVLQVVLDRLIHPVDILRMDQFGEARKIAGPLFIGSSGDLIGSVRPFEMVARKVPDPVAVDRMIKKGAEGPVLHDHALNVDEAADQFPRRCPVEADKRIEPLTQFQRGAKRRVRRHTQHGDIGPRRAEPRQFRHDRGNIRLGGDQNEQARHFRARVGRNGLQVTQRDLLEPGDTGQGLLYELQ